MIKKKNTLSVKPLRRYNTPVYPSYLDKNPIEHPDTLPYPFTYKALQVLAAAGILMGTSCSSEKTPSSMDSATQNSLVNPFPFENLDIPFIPPMHGTGLPARLKSEQARETIHKVFREEGIKLEENYVYTKNGINVKLDGYNAKRNIGFVWLDYENQGAGVINSWRSNFQYYSHIESEVRDAFDSLHPNGLEYTKSYLARFIGNEISWDEIEEYSDRFNRIDDLANEEEKMFAYGELYLDMLIHKTEHDESLQFPTHKINESNSYEQKKTVYVNWRLKEEFEEMTENIPNKETLHKILDAVLEIEDETQKEKYYNDLVNFVNPGRHWMDDSPPDNSRFIKDVEQMKQRIYDYANGLSDEKIALREAQKFDSLPQINGDFIAPIGMRDDRFAYDFFDRYHFTEGQRDTLRKMEKTDTEEELYETYFKFTNKQERHPKDVALRELETQVRQYIQWAKQQSGN